MLGGLTAAHMGFAGYLERIAVLVVSLVGDGEERLVHLNYALKPHVLE